MKKVNLWKMFKSAVIVTLVLGFFLSTNVLTLVKAAINILIPPTISFVDENDTTIEKVELEHLREKNLKVYLMPNYTLEYVYYDKDIHYFDGEKYQEITSIIEERNNTQIVKNHNYQVIFPNTINEDESIIPRSIPAAGCPSPAAAWRTAPRSIPAGCTSPTAAWRTAPRSIPAEKCGSPAAARRTAPRSILTAPCTLRTAA